MGLIVYYSSRSENTHRFLLKLGRRLFRLPLGAEDDVPHVSEPYVLVTPTYGGRRHQRPCLSRSSGF